LNLISNPLDNGMGNNLQDLIPTAPPNTAVFFFDKAAQNFRDPYEYFQDFGWFSASDPALLNAVLAPGDGAFLRNFTSSTIPHTFTGTTLAPVPVTLPLNAVCFASHRLLTPNPAGYANIIGSPPPAGFCTRVYRFDPVFQKYRLFTYDGVAWFPSAPAIPTGEAAAFIRAPLDNTPPTLVSASANFASAPPTVLLEFSEPVHPDTAENLSNYTLVGVPGGFTAAQMYPVTTPPAVDSKYVLLTAPGLLATSGYGVRVSGVRDLCGNFIAPCAQIGFGCSTPANDLCANAIAVGPGSTMGTTKCATQDGVSACDSSCPGPDVWYTFSPPGNGSATIATCGSPLDTVLSIYTACPTDPAAIELACDIDSCGDNETITLPSVTACELYYIRVAGDNASPGGSYGDFTLTVTFTAAAPPNDLCANATLLGTPSILSGNGVFPFDTTSAGTDGPAAQPVANDVWFKYKPNCSGPVYVSTCGTLFNTSLAVYKGSCASLTLEIFNDDATAGSCAGSLQSYLLFAAIANTDYYIRVGSPTGATGCGQLVVRGPEAAPGTCPPGLPSQGGTGGLVAYTRMFEVTGSATGVPWAWCISAPCCYHLEAVSVGPVAAGSPASALVSTFVASINSACPAPPPSRLVASGFGNLMLVTAYGCYDDIVFSVGPAFTPFQIQCVVPNNGGINPLTTAGPCSFNPRIRDIPLTKRDCNENGLDDLVDILTGRSQDADHNRIPDECEPCKRPRFVRKPHSQEVRPGQKAVFTVEVEGTAPLAYQWLRNGIALSDGGHVSGATTAQLSIEHANAIDEGQYRLVVTNPCGLRHSQDVSLALVGERLQITYDKTNVVVRWTATNVFLQQATQVTGRWDRVSNAVSPLVIKPPFDRGFFRLEEK
jgi:hypothetical protein